MKKKSGSGFLLLAFLLFCAFLLWFFWPEVTSWVERAEKKPAPAQTKGAPKEKISEEERKKLDEILRERRR